MTEPEPHMLNILRNKIDGVMKEKCIAAEYSADALNFPDNSFDAVVSTLVLCSVDSAKRALGEIKRVLKPEGKFYFIEHVIAKDTPHLIKWQKLFQPIWILMCGNCYLTRDTESSIVDAGFQFQSIERLRSTGSPPIVSPTIKGIAINGKIPQT
ncbi:MAG: methyltransferase domain-containing protein [Nitrosomonas sp.]